MASSINPGFHPAQLAAGALYMLRGQYAHSSVLLAEALACERAGTGHQFIGTYVFRALLHLNSGEREEARALLDSAIATYAPMDHVYAETMTSFAHFTRGRLAEYEGDYALASKCFTASMDIADRNDHRLAIGAHWVKSMLGLARNAQRRSDKQEADRLLTDAIDMLTRKTRFVWVSFIGASDAESWYEVSATYALRGENLPAIDALQRAVTRGWANSHQINHDPCFDSLRDADAVRKLMNEAAGVVTLPAPFGSGGFPELGEL